MNILHDNVSQYTSVEDCDIQSMKYRHFNEKKNFSIKEKKVFESKNIFETQKKPKNI